MHTSGLERSSKGSLLPRLHSSDSSEQLSIKSSSTGEGGEGRGDGGKEKREGGREEKEKERKEEEKGEGKEWKEPV